MQIGDLQETVRQAANQGISLAITGAGSKSFLGNPVAAEPLCLAEHAGILDYHPEELVVRVKAGTTIEAITRTLDAAGQMLAFDPPDHGGSTIGGVISAGLSGSRRPWAGAARDFVLGVGFIDAAGRHHEFGGQVMKNVAGYDVSRLVCGAFGTLGVITDISLKVLPKPAVESSVALSLSLPAAMEQVAALGARVSGLSGCCYIAEREQLLLRFSGTAASVERELSALGGETQSNDVWSSLDRQGLRGSEDDELWRLSTDPLEPMSQAFDWMDWGFAQRWLRNPGGDPRDGYTGCGHWTRFTAKGEGAPFQTPAPGLMKLHQRLKQAFDPAGLFNPGRMYRDL